MSAVAEEVKQPIKLDVGCGKAKKEGFIGIDSRDFEGVDHVLDVGSRALPYEDGTVSEIHTSHFVEHLNASERIHFINEAYRVLENGGKLTVITPHWSSCRAYGDLTHQWPPVSEFWFYYLDKNWRAANAPHNDAYTCDFAATWGYSMHHTLHGRNQEFQQFAFQHFKEAAQDVHATLVARK